MCALASLRHPADFARLRRHGRRLSTKSLTIYRADARAGDGGSLVGIAVNKTIGKAVVRNKLRRRLSAILRQTLCSQPATRVLIVARPPAAQLPFADLAAEVTSALAAAY
ncbi:MAG TPA: ribonuclease P protein component [Candidatus Cybelea sp.]|jgi:ribonuclease P protein component|nr:ribonuclease P protein component [Candidatus Cybelea sp.]